MTISKFLSNLNLEKLPGTENRILEAFVSFLELTLRPGTTRTAYDRGTEPLRSASMTSFQAWKLSSRPLMWRT